MRLCSVKRAGRMHLQRGWKETPREKEDTQESKISPWTGEAEGTKAEDP